MSRSIYALLLACYLLGGTPASAREDDARDWVYEQAEPSINAVTINLVRGEAMIIRRPGPVHISIKKYSPTNREEEVSIDMTRHNGKLEITDIYSKHIFNMWKEGLPITFRGNFSSSDVRLKAVISAPENVNVSVEFMDGTVVGTLGLNLSI